MPIRPIWFALIGFWASIGQAGADPGVPTDLSMTPAGSIKLRRLDRLQVLVTGAAEGRPVDLTRRVELRSTNPEVAAVDRQGRVTARAAGTAGVIAAMGPREVCLQVEVEGPDPAAPPTFEHDIQPLLARFGCNAGACHGKASGQNGFKLSLLGFDANSDHAAVSRDVFGRRVNPGDPDRSLLLTKAIARVPHGGGPRLAAGDPEYEILRTWIAAAMPRDAATSPKLAGLAVRPPARVLRPGEEQQLVVTARYSDGSTRDVTDQAAYQSSESVVVAATERGLVRAGTLPGEAAITARFEGTFASCDVAIPVAGEVPAAAYEAFGRRNFIDDHVLAKLRTLGLTPSEPAGDATFLRRASLDVIGRLPTPDEARAFLADPAPDRRDRLVAALLDRPEYADHWANKWADLLRPNPYRVGIKAVFNLDGWLRAAFRRNMPYDQFARAIVAARGSTFADGPSVVFRDRREPEEAATMVSQVFLGIRLDCAKCHHHPFEVWSQDDFYGFAAFFARIGRKGTGLSPPISGSEEVLFTATKGAVKHPLTGKELPPKPLFGTMPPADARPADPREALAAWMTAPDNPYFAKVDRQPGLGRPDGPGDRRPRGRHPGHEPAVERAAPRGPRRRLPPPRLRPEVPDPDDHGLGRLRPLLDARRPQRRRRPELLAPLSPPPPGRGDARRGLRRHRGPRVVRGGAARHAGRRALDGPDRFPLPRRLRPARPEPGPALRADGRHLGRPGAPPDERAPAPGQARRRLRPGRPARRRR